MLPSERLKGIDVFVTAADLGSFTAAAKRLHLTISAVSKSAARLEERPDCRLFVRTTRSLKLSDEGVAFHSTCVRVLGDVRQREQGLPLWLTFRTERSASRPRLPLLKLGQRWPPP
jgi:DNA-binding transcriptional LysR family regulator